MEYWIVFDAHSGAVRWRGQGEAGGAAVQVLPEGCAIMTVPMAAVAGAELDLSVIKSSLGARIDAVAEEVRLQFITPGAGQAITYLQKAAEADALMADPSAAAPMLSAEADALGIAADALAGSVIAARDRWLAVATLIEAARRTAKVAIAAAANLADLRNAASVDWPAQQATD